MMFLIPKRSLYPILLLGFTLLLLNPLTAWSAVNHAAQVILAKGQVTAVNQAGESRKLKRRSKVFSGDIIKTGTNGSVQLRFIDKALMTIKANSEMDISSYQSGENGQKEEAIMNLVKGGFRTITGKIGKGDKSAYKVSTPAASIGIRGTNYEVQQEPSGGFVMAVYSGGISVQNESGTLDLGLGSDFNFVRVSSGSAPVGLLSAPESLSENAATDSSPEEENESEEGNTDEGETNDDSDSASDDNGSDEDKKGTVASNDSSDNDGASGSTSSDDSSEEASPIDEAITAVQAELSELDEGTEEVLKEVVAALDSKLIEEVEDNKEVIEEQVTQELVEGGYLEEGETLADLEDAVKENLANLGSLEDLESELLKGTDLTEPDIIPDPDPTTDPNTDPDPGTTPDPTDPSNFIEGLYANLTTVTSPFPDTVVSQTEFNLIASDKLAVMAMPLNYNLDADGNPQFSFHEAQIGSPNLISLSNFAGFNYATEGNQTGFSIYYEVINTDNQQTQEFELRVDVNSDVVTIGDLQALIDSALVSGNVYVDGSQTPLGVEAPFQLIQVDPTGQSTDIRFVFQPQSGASNFITRMELQFWDEGSAAGQALMTQLGGTTMIGENDWYAQADTEMIISSGAWQIAAEDGSGSPILYIEDTRTENVDGQDVEVSVEEIVNKPLEPNTVGSLVSLGICGTSDPAQVCDIAVDVVRASERIRWGAWLAEPGEGISITKLGVDGFTDTNTDEQVLAFWLAAERADISQLTGTAQFSSTTNTNCTDFSQCIGFADDGVVQSVTGQFNVNFDTGAISNGSLNINVTDDPNLFSSDLGPTTSQWDVNFQGQLSTSSTGTQLPEFTTSNINGVVKDGAGNQISNQVIGNVGGIFVKPGDVFAGGYNIGTTDGTNKQASGVFTLDKVP
jgi:hypothetical protein